MNGKTHLFRVKSGKNIAEVPGGNHHVNLFSALDLLLFQQLCIGIHIINDLGDKTADIDGVCRRKLIACSRQLLCQILV